MCGCYTLRTPLNVLAEQFLFDMGDVQAVPRYNIPPRREVLAVRHPRELGQPLCSASTSLAARSTAPRNR